MYVVAAQNTHDPPAAIEKDGNALVEVLEKVSSHFLLTRTQRGAIIYLLELGLGLRHCEGVYSRSDLEVPLEWILSEFEVMRKDSLRSG